MTFGTPALEPTGNPRADLERLWSGYVGRIAAADQHALAALYDASNRLIYGLALRILRNPADAEEVTLDTFTQVWRTAANFDAHRGSVLSWLVTMARSRAIDKLRASGRHGMECETPMGFGAGTAPGDFDPALQREVRGALEALSPEQREAIELVYWYGYSHAELAARLGQPLGTVKTRIRTGMIKLRSHLGSLA